MKIVITGAEGFIGKNLRTALQPRGDVQLCFIGRESSPATLNQTLADADFIYHLAGVNRPQRVEEFAEINTAFTEQLCRHLLDQGRAVPIVFSSSSQAELDNPYGNSKRAAEAALAQYASQSGATVGIYRLPNVFGKWSRPNYNSVVATFCHNLARQLPITVNDPQRALTLVYIDDVVAHFQAELAQPRMRGLFWREVSPAYQTTVGALAELIERFGQLRTHLVTPDFGDAFTHKLYATYLSYLPEDRLAYALDQKCDPRGCLAEFIKSPAFGQIFISRTAPGITRGNHYHHTKTEKFLVLEGQAVIRFRHIERDEVIEYPVRGEEFRVVDIPPGYTHSIENVGTGELVTLFWASEIFAPNRPDTYMLPVKAAA